METSKQIVFDYMMSKSYETLRGRLAHITENLDDKEQMLRLLAHSKSAHLVQVNSFFQAEKFKGFVLNFRIADEDEPDMAQIDYEVFFKPIQMLEIMENKNNGNFLKVVQKIEISSNYDAKEQILLNYAGIIDQTSNPQLLIQVDPIDEPLSLTITWANNEGIFFFWLPA